MMAGMITLILIGSSAGSRPTAPWSSKTSRCGTPDRPPAHRAASAAPDLRQPARGPAVPPVACLASIIATAAGGVRSRLPLGVPVALKLAVSGFAWRCLLFLHTGREIRTDHVDPRWGVLRSRGPGSQTNGHRRSSEHLDGLSGRDTPPGHRPSRRSATSIGSTTRRSPSAWPSHPASPPSFRCRSPRRWIDGSPRRARRFSRPMPAAHSSTGDAPSTAASTWTRSRERSGGGPSRPWPERSGRATTSGS
jgi:hypothetical protein